MINCINHVTVVIKDLPGAIDFFQKLGFELKTKAFLSEEKIFETMGISNSGGADHIALSLEPNKPDSFEIQLLHYRNIIPEPFIPASEKRSFRLGYDHIAFEVKNLDDAIKNLEALNVTIIKQPFIVGLKKLAFLEGPEGITIEFAELLG